MKYISVTLLLFIAFLPVHRVSAKEVTMTFDQTIVPFVLADQDGGIQVDIIREALAFKGHTLVAVYVSAKRMMHELKIGAVDAASSGSYDPATEKGFHYGIAPFSYRNAFFTLEERSIDIQKPSDIDDFRIATFQNAKLIWPDWLEPIDQKNNYIEVADQSLQPKMLEHGRVDAVVADQTIFAYYTRLLEKQSGKKLKPTVAYSFTDPVSFPPVFKSEQIRDDFNEGIQHLLETSRHEEIFDAYLK